MIETDGPVSVIAERWPLPVRREVGPGRPRGPLGEPVSYTAVSAREVKDRHVRLELEQAPDYVDICLGDVAEQRLWPASCDGQFSSCEF